MDEVRRLRKMKGLSQVELAERSGVSAYTITEVETGRREPHGRTLRKLATALGVEVGDLFPKVPSQPPNVERLADNLSAHLAQIKGANESRLRSKLGRAKTREERRQAGEDYRYVYLTALSLVYDIEQAVPGALSPEARRELADMHATVTEFSGRAPDRDPLTRETDRKYEELTARYEIKDNAAHTAGRQRDE